MKSADDATRILAQLRSFKAIPREGKKVKGRRRGRSQRTLDLIDACREILERIQPATVRAVCYQLFVAKLISSMAKPETDRISSILARARESGEIPWEWVVDETRDAERVASCAATSSLGGTSA